MDQPTDYAQELRSAYSAFAARAAPHEKLAVDALLEEAHTQAGEVLAGRRSHVDQSHLVVAWGMLHPEPRPQVVERFNMMEPPFVDGHGGIWSRRKYEQTDPGWSAVLVQFLGYLHNKAGFRTTPQIKPIADAVTLALVGDWGTGYWRQGTGAEGVATHIYRQQPEYSVHLGDVYYAGTQFEEVSEFIKLWPAGKRGSFALNSNHDMYSGSHAYFELTLAASGPFDLQRGTSYFALFNKHWVLVGLDSAYFSPPLQLYKQGIIDPIQEEFLGQIGNQFTNHRVVVVSHHEGLSLTGDQRNQLWTQVTSALGRVPDYWYWGHAHNAVVYKPQGNCRCRCLGHGAIPYGNASDLAGAPAVEWYETGGANDTLAPERVLNGYVLITLDGESLIEVFMGEDGSVRWC
jgi:hypothetical protein